MFGKKFQRKYALSDQGIRNTKQATFWTVIVNLIVMGGMGILYLMMKHFSDTLINGTPLPGALPVIGLVLVFVLLSLITHMQQYRATYGLVYGEVKNVRITLKKGKKSLYSEQGEMLFTHFGFSGPLILEASCHLPADISDCMLELDLKPGLTREQLDARLQRDLEAGSRKQFRNILPGLMPGSLAEIFPSICGLPAGLPCNQVTASQREVLVNRMKTLPLDISGRRPIAEAVITRGGVSVKEVNPGTMESKLIPGLYFAGEILDVDAHTGGYNLQIAFSTGALAGNSAATAG